MNPSRNVAGNKLFRVLLLGGTGEGASLAERLAPRTDLEVTSSLAGRVQQPKALQGAARTGGFGGIDGLTSYIESNAIDVVIDVTHPFAATMSQHAEAACTATGVPLLAYLRPAWSATDGDCWQEVADVESAAKSIGLSSKRVFLAIGRQELRAFVGCVDAWFLVRAIDAPTELPQRCEVILDRGPFKFADEVRLLQKYAIEILVSKNSGGESTYAKIAAARTLGIPVVIISRPPKHKIQILRTLNDVVAQLNQLVERKRSE